MDGLLGLVGEAPALSPGVPAAVDCSDVTVGIAFVDLGYLNTFVAVSIAVLKATLVLLFFMHVKSSNRLIWVFASAGFIWFIIMVAFTMSDYVGRTWVEAPIPLP